MFHPSVLDKFRLDNKTALVTGSSRGLGAQFARSLAEAGATVIVTARKAADCEATAAAIHELGGIAHVIAGNLSTKESCLTLWKEARETAGSIDILVNNAGICIHDNALDVTEDDWNSVININVNSVWWLAQAAGRHMIERGSGVITNVGSMSGAIVNRPQMQPAYNASKAAVHHLTRSLAAEWGPLGVRVNAIAPGYIRTEMSPVDAPEFQRHWIDDAPMKRCGEPSELGPAMVFLCSDASSFMTGSVLTIDGGYSIF